MNNEHEENSNLSQLDLGMTMTLKEQQDTPNESEEVTEEDEGMSSSGDEDESSADEGDEDDDDDVDDDEEVVDENIMADSSKTKEVSGSSSSEEEDIDSDSDSEENDHEQQDSVGLGSGLGSNTNQADLSRSERLVLLLREKTRSVEAENEQVWARIKEVTHLCKQVSRQRDLLVRKLDRMGDKHFRDCYIDDPGDKNIQHEPVKRRRRGRPSTGNPVGRPKKIRDSSSSLPNRVRTNVSHKRPGRSAFFRFARQNRASVASEMGLGLEMSGEDKKRLARTMADRWNSLTKEEKRAYHVREGDCTNT